MGSTVPLAVLGDSDSESYGGTRGGAYSRHTLQWTEVLGLLRRDQIDLGPWGAWGTPGAVVRLRHWLGLEVPGRAPRKHDFRYNFAASGAHCNDLTSGDERQADKLAALMDQTPARWRDGVVSIRIGINDFGKLDSLNQLAKDPLAAPVQARMTQCLAQVRQAMQTLWVRHPRLRFVLIGTFDNAHWPRYLDKWQSSQELANISAGLSVYDNGLRALAANDKRVYFFDDRAWFTQRWGERDRDGRPAYRTLKLGGEFDITNTAGDDPHHAVLDDGHAGLAWNLCWAKSFVDALNREFGLGIRPITESELMPLLYAALGTSSAVQASMPRP